MLRCSIGLIVLLSFCGPAQSGDKPDPASIEFFENRIRPVLVKHCYSCHSQDAARTGKLKGGLRLDSRASVHKGGDNGPVLVPGKPAASLLIKALHYKEDDLQMPPKGKLPEAVIADLETWIKLGAADPRQGPEVVLTPAERARTHWAFQPIRNPKSEIRNPKSEARNPIDVLVDAKRHAAGLEAAPEADRAMLLRRATFDLLGLPPAPEVIETFLKDDRPDAYERAIDRLLASASYGERWGRHWLDVVRYADSAGYEIDDFYPHAWHYRDYVIRSFNADKAFDRFVQEQVAGDELWPDSSEAKLATGMHTVGPYAFEGGIARPQVVEYQRLTDLADTTSSAFLGLTAGCARCHDHKFDPIAQQDYFGLQAIFAASEAKEVSGMRILAARKQTPTIHVLKRGDLETPGVVAAPAILRALRGGRALEDTDSRRTSLAVWLTSPNNPLTARVIANRVWLWHFGKGLVRTPNDFGSQGEPPTHPALLDYLAIELFRSGWSLKHLHRLIMTSSTYRQSSAGSAEAVVKDPDCRLLSRFPRRRLEAEAVWDALHAAAGTINRKPFGPAVYPPIDASATKTKLNTKWEPATDRREWTRRAVYMVVRRSLVLPMFRTFNGAIPVESVGMREDTVEAAQALALLNGAVAVEQAKQFAVRLRRECGADKSRLIERAWLLAFGRPVTAAEKAKALEFLADGRAASLLELCQALLNANEFLYID